MYNETELNKKLLSFEGASLDFPFGKDVAVYRAGAPPPAGKMFALVSVGSDPVRLSLKCDPALAEVLREKYETILPGYHLNKRHWNTVILSGQLTTDEVDDLISHSHQLVTGAK